MRVRTATRAGGDAPSEDRVFVAPNAVMVLDGASAPDPGVKSGGWLADVLGQRLVDLVTAESTEPLQTLLATAIRSVADEYELLPGEAPSTTVSVVRWDADRVQVLVLGDSPVVALFRSGTVDVIRDDRLKAVATPERAAMRAGGGFGFENRGAWQRLHDRERASRNRDGGYWIAEAEPKAAEHALVAEWDRADLSAVLAMTDGVAVGPTRYGVPASWGAAFASARRSPSELVDAVHAAERGDPAGFQWTRSKRHDDKALALVDFTA
jgi:hypothetical protein